MYGESSIRRYATDGFSIHELFRDRRPRHDIEMLYQELGRPVCFPGVHRDDFKQVLTNTRER